ncbi:MAG: aminotransferase class I/II-fold pyridoxal phosphate-dependent enzyme [Burkholderiaceae bacterium]|nr:aminotransferase class I/II-fold pyridoxal phosphate-dependent enzyme [Burkholderiaceae bacterium]
MEAVRAHGGPDSGPPAWLDLSTNVNPLGPPPPLLAAVQHAPRQRYPDPAYAALRQQLATAQQWPVERLLVSAGSSEAIFRLTLAARLQGVQQVCVPEPGYGDYAAAARSAGLAVQAWRDADQLCAAASCERPTLLWVNDPVNPSGAALDAATWQALGQALRPGVVLAIDQAYAPLRLQGCAALPADLADRAWRLCTPNKALGLPGVRAGWLQAPRDAGPLLQRLQALAPSWVLSAEGVALLGAWTEPATGAWLAAALPTLAGWRAALVQALQRRGWTLAPGVAPFVLGRPPGVAEAVRTRLQRLRAEQGIALRDAASFGLPGWVRIGLCAPAVQAQWLQAWEDLDGH